MSPDLVPQEPEKTPLPAHILKLRASLPKPQRREEVRQLPTWAKVACIKHELAGMSWRKIAEEMKRPKMSVGVYCRSPAAKKFRKALAEAAENPTDAARLAAISVSGHIAVENLMHYEAAKASGDIAEAGRQLRFITEMVGIPQPKVEDQKPTNIIIQFGGATITAELPMGESSSEKIIEAEIIDE